VRWTPTALLARSLMTEDLVPLLSDGVIDEVLGRLKSGKEADLWLVRHGGDTVVAKVYRQRDTRSFRNDAAYREGRQVRDSRTARAMRRGTRFGQAAAEEAWKAKEAEALHTLHAAGVRVPKPLMFYEGVLLMELVVDIEGRPAPRLIDASVTHERAAPLYADLRNQVVTMLCCDIVHGDLSPYNVLLGSNGPVVIDFPQVVGAAHNNQAERFFRRDLENVRKFLGVHDPALHASIHDAQEIWRAYVRRELTPGFVPSGVARGGPAPHAAPHSLHPGTPPHRGVGAQNRGHPVHAGRHGRATDANRAAAPRRESVTPQVIRVNRSSGGPSIPPAAPSSHPPSPNPSHPAQAPRPPEGERNRKRRRRRRRSSGGGGRPPG
jgi:RIO kinase 1